jgi:hypothetical protein
MKLPQPVHDDCIVFFCMSSEPSNERQAERILPGLVSESNDTSKGGVVLIDMRWCIQAYHVNAMS